MLLKDILYPAFAAIVNAKNLFAAIAAAASATLNPTPPKALLAPVPVVLTPAPRIIPDPVKLAATVVGLNGLGPKRLAPLTMGLVSHPNKGD
jgi:hypothetical protein